VLLDEHLRVAAREHEPVARGTAGILRTATTMVDALLSSAGLERGALESIGIGIPGQVDQARGVVRHAFNLDVESFALGPELNRETGVSVTLENDVTAAALGAVHLLDLDGTIAYLNLGTGLAAGIVIDRHPVRGAHGYAGEIGHLPLDPAQLPCTCGERGCLETAASGAALRASWPAGGEHPGETLFASVTAGDTEASAAFERLVWGATSAIRLLGMALDPHAVVIGGGLRLLGDPLFDAIRDRLEEWGPRSPFLGELRLGERLLVLPPHSPAAAVGAALSPVAADSHVSNDSGDSSNPADSSGSHP